MSEALTSVAMRIHDLVFIRGECRTPRNRSALGITTAEARPAECNWQLRVCRKGGGGFLQKVLNIETFTKAGSCQRRPRGVQGDKFGGVQAKNDPIA